MSQNPVTININDSSITIEISDITQSTTECIVNAANRTLLGGCGVDGAIHRAAGPELLTECRTLNGCHTGEAKITKGYRLQAKYVIHTVGPIYQHSANPQKELESCYLNSLKLARQYDIHSIAFPAISCGAYGYPIDDAAKIAFDSIKQWLESNSEYPLNITLSCFNAEIFEVYLSLNKSHMLP